MTSPSIDPMAPMAVSVARLEVKMDNVVTTLKEHGDDLKELKARRFPLPVLGVLLALAGGICGFVSMLHGN